MAVSDPVGLAVFDDRGDPVGLTLGVCVSDEDRICVEVEEGDTNCVDVLLDD